jgi:hypothetical protein
MQDIQQLKETIKRILDSQKLAVLATQRDGRPYGSLVAFAATDDMKNLLFATTRATRKYANLPQCRRKDLHHGEPLSECSGTPSHLMSLILPFEQIIEKDRPRVGGKAYALSVMAKTGARVPSGVCITADTYRRYVRSPGIGEYIRLELSRKHFDDILLW